jgi:hypothetical protein
MVMVIALVAGCSSSGSDTTAAGGGGGAPGATTPPAKLFDTDFKGVCQGATVSKARAYDKTAKTGHKVLYFKTYKDDLVEGLTEMPSDWKVTFDANSDAYAATDLVVCARRTADTFVKDCTGYTDHDKATNNVAKLHTATWTVTAHEATTGNALGTTTLQGTDASCPMFMTFDDDNQSVDYYVEPSSDQVVAFIKPFAQPGPS